MAARKRIDYPWLEIRRDFAKGMSLNAISVKYSIRRATLVTRKQREFWTAPDPAASTTKPTPDLTLVLDLATTHENIVAQLRGLVCESLRKQWAGTLTPGEAQTVESLTRSGATVLKLDREVAGKRVGQPSVEDVAVSNESQTIVTVCMPSRTEFQALRSAGLLDIWQRLYQDGAYAQAADVVERALALERVRHA